MKRVVGFVIVALLYGFLPGTLVYAEIAENQGLFHRQIKLYTGDAQDSYLLVFPVEVTQPGRVECEFKLLRPDEERYQRTLEKIRQERGKAFMFRWSLVDSRFFDQKKPMEPGKFQQWLQEANNYNPVEYLAGDQIRGMVRGAKAALDFVFGKKKKKQAPVYLHGYSQSVRFPHTPDNHVTTGRMRHDIDFNELAQTQGMYFLVLENFSQLTPELEVKVSFPGKQHQVDKDFLLPRDLGITALQVHGDHVYVEVQNLGEASLPQELYTRKGKDAATLMLWLDGKSWGGVTLARLDPAKNLLEPGGKAGYTFKVAVADNSEVVSKLTLPKFEDADAGNNEKKQLRRALLKGLTPIKELQP
jgi:hypothetical protein